MFNATRESDDPAEEEGDCPDCGEDSCGYEEFSHCGHDLCDKCKEHADNCDCETMTEDR